MGLLCAGVSLRLTQGAEYVPSRNVSIQVKNVVKKRSPTRTPVITKQQQKLLYLPPSNVVVGCTTARDATLIAKVFAEAGTDPVRSGFAYDTYWKYWNSKSCGVYNYGLTLEPNAVQAAFTTKQNLPVKVFPGQEGEVTPAVFQRTLYVVMMNQDVLANIFRCVHDVNEESGFDRIELCRPNI